MTSPMLAGDFVDRAQEAIDDILSRGRVPVVVGGTMMYVQWLVHGKPDAPKRVRREASVGRNMHEKQNSLVFRTKSAQKKQNTPVFSPKRSTSLQFSIDTAANEMHIVARQHLDVSA